MRLAVVALAALSLVASAVSSAPTKPSQRDLVRPPATARQRAARSRPRGWATRAELGRSRPPLRVAARVDPPRRGGAQGPRDRRRRRLPAANGDRRSRRRLDDLSVLPRRVSRPRRFPRADRRPDHPRGAPPVRLGRRRPQRPPGCVRLGSPARDAPARRRRARLRHRAVAQAGHRRYRPDDRDPLALSLPAEREGDGRRRLDLPGQVRAEGARSGRREGLRRREREGPQRGRPRHRRRVRDRAGRADRELRGAVDGVGRRRPLQPGRLGRPRRDRVVLLGRLRRRPALLVPQGGHLGAEACRAARDHRVRRERRQRLVRLPALRLRRPPALGRLPGILAAGGRGGRDPALGQHRRVVRRARPAGRRRSRTRAAAAA